MSETEYRVEVTRRAAKDLRGLNPENWRRVRQTIDALARDPRPDGCKKLTASEDIYRVRVGDYRVLYRIRDGILLVIVIRVGHRSEVYKGRG